MEGEPKPDREDSVHFTRHSKAQYRGYSEDLASEHPNKARDVNEQPIPDLTEAGVELAEKRGNAFFTRFDPKNDAMFFTSSDQVRALETADKYRTIAHDKGFEVIRPEHGDRKLASEIGEGEIRVVKNLSLDQSDPLLASVFSPDSQRGPINWDAVDLEYKERWSRAHEIIQAHDYGSFGANFYHHSEAIKVIFPEIATSQDLFESQFKNTLRLAEFAIKKAKESRHPKNIRILAFGHENYLGYALNKYFEEHEIKNCETIDIEISDAGEMTISKGGEKREI